MTPQITIHHGELLDIEGPARRWGQTAIVPAKIGLKGRSFHQECDFCEFATSFPVDVQNFIQPNESAAWVMGRLIRLFFIRPLPEEERAEKTCMHATFLAFFPDENIGVPFEYTDYYGRTGLMFSSDDAPTSETKQRIADAFWNILLEEPRDVENYEERVYHTGAGVWIRFGVEFGQPFMKEMTEELE